MIQFVDPICLKDPLQTSVDKNWIGKLDRKLDRELDRILQTHGLCFEEAIEDLAGSQPAFSRGGRTF